LLGVSSKNEHKKVKTHHMALELSGLEFILINNFIRILSTKIIQIELFSQQIFERLSKIQKKHQSVNEDPISQK